MFTVNLEEELLEISEIREMEEDEYLKSSPQARELHKYNQQVDKEMLSKFGTIDIVTEVDTKLKLISDRREKYSLSDLKKIFNINDIRKICTSYRLRFLPISKYKGTIDDDVPSKMREFQDGEVYKKIDNVFFRENYKKGEYYIIAPAESFVLSERPKDPLLFCYLGDDMFYLVCKWGNDLSVTRKIKSYMMSNIGWITLVALIAFVVIGNIFHINVNTITGIIMLPGTIWLMVMLFEGFPKRSSEIWDSHHIK